jgi:predicted dehydrogenase
MAICLTSAEMTAQRSRGVGLIGCGRIGEKRAAALPDGCALRAAHDVNRQSAESLARRFSAAVSNNSDELLARDDIDIVVIATTHDHLAQLAVTALERGKHVFVEKPGGRNPDELRLIHQAAKRTGLVAAVGFNHRFHPAIAQAKVIIDSGEYGRLLWLRGRYGHGGRLGYEREWRASRALSGGGELLDQGCHLIDLTLHLCGTAELDYARLTTSFWPMEVEDNAFLALRLAGGATAWLHVSWTEWKNLFSLEITLEKAKLEVGGLGGSYGTEVLVVHRMKPEMGPPTTTRTEFAAADDSWRLELLDFIARIEGRTSTGADLPSSVAVHEIIAEAYRR